MGDASSNISDCSLKMARLSHPPVPTKWYSKNRYFGRALRVKPVSPNSFGPDLFRSLTIAIDCTVEVRLPAHLLSRPYLVDYLVHLQRSAVGADFKEPGSAGSVSTSQALQATGQASYQEILQQAAGVGALRAVRNILRQSDVHEPAACIRTPLHAACMNGRDEVVRLLLEARVSPTSADRNGVQPIHLAAQGGSEEVLTLLITARAKLDATSAEKQTVLHFAARSGAPGAVLNLLMAEPLTRKTRGARASSGGSGLKIDVSGSAAKSGSTAQPHISRLSDWRRRMAGAGQLCTGPW